MIEEQRLPSIDDLEALIGRRVQYRERTWVIIEVLEEELAIVLQADASDDAILSNAQGEPVRSLPRVMTLPVRDEESGGINPEMSAMEVLDPDD